MTRERIIEIFLKYIFNITSQSGTEYFVVEEDDFEEIAEQIIQEFELEKQELIDCMMKTYKEFERIKNCDISLRDRIYLDGVLTVLDGFLKDPIEKHTGKTIEELLK